MAVSEKDNRGIRHDSVEKALAYWMVERRQSGPDSPFVMYEFSSLTAATEALLELPCIQKAGDSGNLICTEALIFGCYLTDSTHCEAVMCGDPMTNDLWRQAHAAFEKHGGMRKNDQKPREGHSGMGSKVDGLKALSVWDCGDAKEIRAFIDAGGDIHARDSDQLTLLHLAATWDLVEATRNLLAFGADPDLPVLPGHAKRTIDVVRANRRPNWNAIESLLIRGG